MNGLLGKKIQEMGRKKLTNGVKNSLKVEENSVGVFTISPIYWRLCQFELLFNYYLLV